MPLMIDCVSPGLWRADGPDWRYYVRAANAAEALCKAGVLLRRFEIAAA